MSQGQLVVLAREGGPFTEVARAYFACLDDAAPKRLLSAADAPDAASSRQAK